MERGDLAVSVRPSYAIVLEGVLADITPITRSRRFRGEEVTGYNLHWLDIPLRRLATVKRRFPQLQVDLITFISQDVADDAAQFLEGASIPYDSLSYWRLEAWLSVLPYQDEGGLTAIYDSDTDRLDNYGQLGRAVTKGSDW
jgi:hypothetical protein